MANYKLEIIDGAKKDIKDFLVFDNIIRVNSEYTTRVCIILPNDQRIFIVPSSYYGDSPRVLVGITNA